MSLWRRWTSRWSLPGWVERHSLTSGPDVMGLLVTQGEVSVKALNAFESWSKNPDRGAARHVRELEHEADDARHALVAKLRVALATPIGQEDLFVLSERCDRVVNRTKNIVAEAEDISWAPDAHAAKMAEQLRGGMDSILEGFKTLTARSDETSQAALDATHQVRRVEHEYRHSMAQLQSESDLRVVFTAREMYRFYARAAEALESLADRLWYAVLAEP